MPFVTCPTCGERGKITSSLIGVRIKCRKCNVSFLVSPPTTKAGGTGTSAGAAAAIVSETRAGSAAGETASGTGLSAAVELQGIEVEGLDASSWTLPTETAAGLAHNTPAAHTTPAAVHDTPVADAHAAAPTESVAPFMPVAAREYKLLTSRDKYFDGKFDLARLEAALNHFARLGWVAKSMSVPHFKGYTGAMEEVIVVLLERCQEAS